MRVDFRAYDLDGIINLPGGHNFSENGRICRYEYEDWVEADSYEIEASHHFVFQTREKQNSFKRHLLKVKKLDAESKHFNKTSCDEITTGNRKRL